MAPSSAFLDEFCKIASAPVHLSVEQALDIHYAVMSELSGVKLASAEMDALYKELFLEKLAWPGSKVINVGGEVMDLRQKSGLGYKDIGKKLEGLGGMFRLPQGVSVEDAMAAGNSKGALGRVFGEGLHSAGHHMGHASTVGKLMNPLGKPVGGMFEGVARGAGQELQRAGGAVHTGLAGAAKTLGGGLRGSVGRALETHAPRIGQGGEILGAAGTATALGAAVSPAAAGLASIAKGTGMYGHMHHALGGFGTNLAKDVAATGLESGVGALAKRLPGAAVKAMHG
jgi:hypothetical protein